MGKDIGAKGNQSPYKAEMAILARSHQWGWDRCGAVNALIGCREGVVPPLSVFEIKAFMEPTPDTRLVSDLSAFEVIRRRCQSFTHVAMNTCQLSRLKFVSICSATG